MFVSYVTRLLAASQTNLMIKATNTDLNMRHIKYS